MTNAPVFLFCSERSGSNLISNIVGAHSAFYALPPLHFGREVLGDLNRIRAGGLDGDAWARARGWVSKRLTQFVDAETAAAADAHLENLTEIDPIALARYLYLDSIPAAFGARVFVKENNLHRMLYFVRDAFPDAKFVYQVRDPRDYLASTKAVGKGDGNKFGNDRAALRVWREDQEGALTALGFLGPERVFAHRYEDLLTDPKGVLTRLFDFLDVSFEASTLDFHKTDAATRIAASNKQRANVAKPLITNNFAKYRNTLKGKDVRQVERRVGDLMAQLGYPLEKLQNKAKGVEPLLPLLEYPIHDNQH